MQDGTTGYLKALKITHKVLLAGQCLLLGIVVFLVAVKKLPPATPQLDKLLQVFALLLAFTGGYAATIVFKKKLANINGTAANVTAKLASYRAANIVKWAIVEGAAIFSMMCFLLTGNYSFAALSLALIIFFVLLSPSVIKIMLQLQLSQQEADALQ
ncbi:MAG: hypothetical protein ABIQ88_15875 [Chitinophagaceae bacterium]